MSKIKKITVSNLKALSTQTADFNGCTAIITGGNNKGKTSFLRSLPDRLRGIKPDVILKSGESDGSAEWELTTGEKFIWTFNEKSEKLTFITKDNIKVSISKEISMRYFPDIFDVDRFLNDSPAKQRKTLQDLVGLDFSDIDFRYKYAYEDRTYKNRIEAEAKVKLKPIDEKLPIEEVPDIELRTELAGVESYNENVKRISDGIKTKQGYVAENDDEIDSLLEKIEALKAKNITLKTEIDNGVVWLDKNKVKDKEIVGGLELKIKEIEDQNTSIKENNKAIEDKKAYDLAVKDALDSDSKVKAIEKEKDTLIKTAKLPEGFGFSDDGITYNNLPFTREQLSSSGIYIAALKLASMSIGEVKALHFDASFLDKNSLSDIEKWAVEQDLQLLIERPDFEGGEIEYELITDFK